MRVWITALAVGMATAGVAVGQTDLPNEPWAPVVSAAAQPPHDDSRSADDVASDVAEPGRARAENANRLRDSPSWRNVEIVDPWLESEDAITHPAKAQATARLSAVSDGDPSPGSWAPVLHEPAPHFSRVSTQPAEAKPATWARPVAEIVNPWRPSQASWVPSSEVIIDPWSRP